MVQLLGLSGSLRAGSYNTAVLMTLAERLGDKAQLRLHALHEIPLYNQDFDGDATPASVRELKAAIAESDGVVLCSPEYNYGMSGVLKNALDWASRPAMKSVLRGKPVLLMSCSPSPVGGARAHAQMRETLSACLAWVLPRPQLIIADARQKIAAGRLTDGNVLAVIDAAVGELIEHIGVLQRTRA